MASLAKEGKSFSKFLRVIHQGEEAYPPSKKIIEAFEEHFGGVCGRKGKSSSAISRDKFRKMGFIFSNMFIVSYEFLYCSPLMEN